MMMMVVVVHVGGHWRSAQDGVSLFCSLFSSQTYRAYLKQPTIFEYGKHRKGVGKAVRKPGDKSATRYYKKIGLGFRTPDWAINGKYIDKKCPWTGNVSIRGRVYGFALFGVGRLMLVKQGRILRGRIISTKMDRTVIVRRDSLHYVRCAEVFSWCFFFGLSRCVQEVQPLREAPPQHCRARLARFFGQGGWDFCAVVSRRV
jgi:hypothetical protein